MFETYGPDYCCVMLSLVQLALNPRMLSLAPQVAGSDALLGIRLSIRQQ